ncbi:amino acid ABC transporter permease [Paraburkholderia sediminicola]|uniref:amino acid ABC transporter permease n=1 Tax=Paraburkholderia TaxID=1822464 RepID=UPI0038BC687B
MATHYQWDWRFFLEPVSTGEPTNYLGWLISGLQNTLTLALCASAIALLVGVCMGIMRSTPSKVLSGIGTTYVALFRNVPLIVQFFLWYFVLPELVPTPLGAWFKQLPSNAQFFSSAILCLGLFTGARVCEQIRAGIKALPRGQQPAAVALGLTLPQAYRYVLLPVAFRVVIPPMTSEFLNVFKNSAVASAIGLLDLSAQSQQLVDYTSHAYESFIAATLIYVAINSIVMAFMRWVDRKARLPGYIGSK